MWKRDADQQAGQQRQVVSRHADLRHGLLRSGWALKICVLE